jgi:hypothetical protein
VILESDRASRIVGEAACRSNCFRQDAFHARWVAAHHLYQTRPNPLGQRSRGAVPKDTFGSDLTKLQH